MRIVHIICFFVQILIFVHGDTFDVTEHGAIADGTTDNTQAFLETWKLACDGGGTMLVPDAGGQFMVNRIELDGPCNGGVTFQLDGVILAPEGTPYSGCWFTFHGIDGLTVQGSGTFDGNGPSAWGHCPCSASLGFYGIKNSNIQGITSKNSKGFQIILDGGDGVTFNQVTITAPGDSANTDGINMVKSNNIHIIDCNIGTGDDCIAINEGSTNINVSGVNCGPGHGISIGSIGGDSADQNVQGVFVSGSTFTSTQNGLRIKTRVPSYPITVSDVTYQDITMDNANNPIFIDQHYCLTESNDCPGESKVQVSNVKFIGVSGTSGTQNAVILQCSQTTPCQGIHLENIDISLSGGGQAGSVCENVQVDYAGTQNPPPCQQ